MKGEKCPVCNLETLTYQEGCLTSQLWSFKMWIITQFKFTFINQTTYRPRKQLKQT